MPLRTAVAEAVAMVQPEAEARGQGLSVDCEDGVACDADPDQLRRILLNLLGNAVKYTPEAGSIRVEARREAAGDRGRCRVDVVDSGPGIPEDQLDEVFQPYLRLATQNGHDAEGSGLGLAIARSLARRMDGDINASNVEAGGARFTLTLRAAEA